MITSVFLPVRGEIMMLSVKATWHSGDHRLHVIGPNETDNQENMVYLHTVKRTLLTLQFRELNKYVQLYNSTQSRC